MKALKALMVMAAVAAWIVVIITLVSMTANAAETPTITVDGTTYEATKVTPGGTIHFETPETNPGVAYTQRHSWEGHGSEHLPCEGGIHWIDNKNVLTISNCLEGTSTTTTTPSSTTTTEQESTTTTAPSDSTTTTVEGSTTSSSTPTSSTLPFTGLDGTSPAWAAAALALVALGGLVVRAARDR